MAQINVTRYECELGLFPALCVQCGAPSAASVARPLPVAPAGRGWRWLFPVFLMLYLAVPAVLVLVVFVGRPPTVGVPVCDAHRGHWAWRYRVRSRILWPLVVVASLAVQAACLASWILTPWFYAHAAAGVLMVGLVIDISTVGRREVRLVRGSPTEVRLTNVHPDFVNALIEDRARDRVDNPDRRALRGDIRDDYDDELA